MNEPNIEYYRTLYRKAKLYTTKKSIMNRAKSNLIKNDYLRFIFWCQKRESK